MTQTRTERMTELLSDCFSAVEAAERKAGRQLDGAERQDLIATLYIQEQRNEEMDRRWPKQKDLKKIKAHIIPTDSDGKPIDIGPHEYNSQEAADYVAEKKIRDLQLRRESAEASPSSVSNGGAEEIRDKSKPRKTRRKEAGENNPGRRSSSTSSEVSGPDLSVQLEQTLRMMRKRFAQHMEDIGHAPEPEPPKAA